MFIDESSICYYQNSLGEVCAAPCLARFKDTRDDAWVAIQSYRHGEPICLKADKLLSQEEAYALREQAGQSYFL